MNIGILAPAKLAIVAGGAWLMTGCGAFSSGSNAPAVMIDKSASDARFELLDAMVSEDIKQLDRQMEQETGRGFVRSKKTDDGAEWTFELDDTDFVEVKAKISEVSPEKSELDVAVKLVDSPLTKDSALEAQDIALLENVFDSAFTEQIAAKLEGRPADKSVSRKIELKLELANAVQRGGFKTRLKNAFVSTIEPILKKHSADRLASYRSRSYERSYSGSGVDDYRAREAQRQASAATSSTEPMTKLPGD